MRAGDTGSPEFQTQLQKYAAFRHQQLSQGKVTRNGKNSGLITPFLGALPREQRALGLHVSAEVAASADRITAEVAKQLAPLKRGRYIDVEGASSEQLQAEISMLQHVAKDKLAAERAPRAARPRATKRRRLALGDPLRVGTDCSGIEAPIQALENLGVLFRHVFSSDKDKHARDMIRTNFAPAGSGHQLYGDITQRDHSRAPKCDVYVAGWPCQGNSAAGKRKGFGDERSQVFYSVVEYIRYHKPRVVLLENVDNLLKVNGGRDFHTVVDVLKKLDSYKVDWRVLNTRDHGVPQNRPRVYILCIRKNADRGTFVWPEPLGATPGIDRFLDTRGAPPAFTNEFAPPTHLRRASDTFDATMEMLEDKGEQPLSRPFLFDISCSKQRSYPIPDTSPCLLTRSRIWISHHGRELNLPEKCRLQGMSPRRLKLVVSEAEFAKQLGNAMSVNVLERILAAALPAAGLTAALDDRWASADAVAALEATRDFKLTGV